MKNKEKRIQEEIEKTLNLLDSSKKSKVNPFFFGKLEHRMQQSSHSSSKPSVDIILPKLALVTLMVLFVCNIITLVNVNSPTETSTDGLSNFAQQYYITSSE